MRKFYFLFLLLLPLFVAANNIQVANISLSGQDINAKTIFINFDLSWENSWRVSGGPANWDAAWVFAKYRTTGGAWNHVNINYVNGTSDQHVAPPGATINTATAGIGCFVYKSADGAGNNNFQNLQLKWNYGTPGLSDAALIEIKVFAIEMVYVPSGSFNVGNHYLSSEQNRFFQAPNFFGPAYPITSENAITVGTATGNLSYNVSAAGSSSGDQLGPIPAAFPKGFNAFYCMKYETSQDQYVAFFNTLTDAQKPIRDLTDIDHKNTDDVASRNGISWVAGFATTVHPDLPVNFVGTDDAYAYMDWAGLRPMTEFEYEKACRGPGVPVYNDFAWGSSEIPTANIIHTLLNAGTSNETISNRKAEEAGVAYISTAVSIGGPLRCGIFAASAINKNRTESGGSYYGIMEMTGNLYERAVSVGKPDGRNFTGLHGNGQLATNGNHNVTAWPGETTGGIGVRGGSFANASNVLQVSDRYDAANMLNLATSRVGFRAVRTAQ